MKRDGVGRRGFVQAGLGTAIAGVSAAWQADPGKVYRETRATPIVGRYQVIVA